MAPPCSLPAVDAALPLTSGCPAVCEERATTTHCPWVADLLLVLGSTTAVVPQMWIQQLERRAPCRRAREQARTRRGAELERLGPFAASRR